MGVESDRRVNEGAGRIGVASAIFRGCVFERFTHMARRVVFFARFEATKCQSPAITIDHLLLGLLRALPPAAEAVPLQPITDEQMLLGLSAEKNAIAKRILRPGEEIADIRERIIQLQMEQKTTTVSDDMPLSDDAKRALEIAIEEADAASHRHVGTGDVLLGLLGVEGTFAHELLSERGFDLAALRGEFAQTDPAENEGTDDEQGYYRLIPRDG